MDEVMNGRRPESWPSWQRFEEYYSEGQLIWLDADTLIRERTGGAHSLDDFAKAFFGAHPGEMQPYTYTLADVVQTLNQICPYDWADFFNTRVSAVAPTAPLEGLARGGYRLSYSEEENPFLKAADKHKHRLTLSSSIGAVIDADDGAITDVSWDSPAFNAGLTEGAQIAAVNGMVFTEERLTDALKAAKAAPEPVELIVRQGDSMRVVALDYHGGLRYPHLVRDGKTPARLDDILKPRK